MSEIIRDTILKTLFAKPWEITPESTLKRRWEGTFALLFPAQEKRYEEEFGAIMHSLGLTYGVTHTEKSITFKTEADSDVYLLRIAITCLLYEDPHYAPVFVRENLRTSVMEGSNIGTPSMTPHTSSIENVSSLEKTLSIPGF